jgi:photosystem II oxygen-evolving enhancer protein 2
MTDGSSPCAPAAGFVPYSGEGYAMLIPARWNPSREVEYNSQVFR